MLLTHFVVSYNRLIGLVGRVFANGLGDLGLIPGRAIKMVLSNIRCVSRVKRSNPRKGVVPSLTHRCSSYWKGSFLVVLDYSRQQLIKIQLDIVSYRHRSCFDAFERICSASWLTFSGCFEMDFVFEYTGFFLVDRKKKWYK